MRSNVLSAVTLAFAGLFATVRADTTWYVLFSNDSGNYAFLDSNNAVIQTSSDTSVDSVAANTDQGERFSWGGNNTYVGSQAHGCCYLGFDSSAQQFKADFSKTHYKDLVKIYIDPKTKTKAYLCKDSNCIGANGATTTDKYLWWFQAVAEA